MRDVMTPRRLEIRQKTETACSYMTTLRHTPEDTDNGNVGRAVEAQGIPYNCCVLKSAGAYQYHGV
jgi:S-adenosylmethionine synthetase